MKILCLWHATDDELNNIKSALPQGTEVVAPRGEYFSRFEASYADLALHAADADAFIGFALPKGILEIAKSLKFFCWLHSGCDDLHHIGALSHFRANGVKLANIRGANAIAVAEQAMMFILALAKKTLFKHQVTLEGRRLFPLFADEYRSAMLHAEPSALSALAASEVASQSRRRDLTCASSVCVATKIDLQRTSMKCTASSSCTLFLKKVITSLWRLPIPVRQVSSLATPNLPQ